MGNWIEICRLRAFACLCRLQASCTRDIFIPSGAMLDRTVHDCVWLLVV